MLNLMTDYWIILYVFNIYLIYPYDSLSINHLHHSGAGTGCEVLRTWAHLNMYIPYVEQQCATAQKNKWCTHQASSSGQQQRCIHCPAKIEYVNFCTPPRRKHPKTWKHVERAAKAFRHITLLSEKKSIISW